MPYYAVGFYYVQNRILGIYFSTLAVLDWVFCVCCCLCLPSVYVCVLKNSVNEEGLIQVWHHFYHAENLPSLPLSLQLCLSICVFFRSPSVFTLSSAVLAWPCPICSGVFAYRTEITREENACISGVWSLAQTEQVIRHLHIPLHFPCRC